MKKRIIAALTAMVMVVTMIPANAFAANTQYTKDRAVQLIAEAAYSGSNGAYADTNVKVPYSDTQKAIVAEARVAYDSLSTEDKIAIENEFKGKADTKISVQDLWLAEALMAYQDNLVKRYVGAIDKLVEDSVDVKENAYADTIKKPIADAKKALTQSVKVNVDATADKATIVDAAKTAKATYVDTPVAIDVTDGAAKAVDIVKEKAAKALFGADFDANNKLAEAKAIVAVTPEVVEKLTADKENEANKTYQTAKAAVETLKDNAKYIKNYRNYVLAKEKLDGFSPKEIVEVTKEIADKRYDVDQTAAVKTAKEALINHKNISEVRNLFNKAEGIYNKYNAMEVAKGSAELKALHDALYGTNGKLGMKNNIKLYDDAVAIKAFVYDTNAKTTDLTIEEIEKIEKIVAEKPYTAASVGVDVLNTIDYSVNVDNADAAPTAKVFKDLVAKKELQVKNLSEIEICDIYGKAINDAIKAVPNNIESLSYVENSDAIVNVFAQFDRLKTAVDSASLGSKFATAPDFEAADKEKYERIEAAAGIRDKEAITNYNANLAKVVKDADFTDFIAKCVAVDKSYEKGVDDADKISANLKTKLDSYLPSAYDGQASNGKVYSVSDESKIKEAIKEYNKALGELNADGKALYNEAQDKLVKANTPKHTDAKRIEYVEARLEAYAYSYNKPVVDKVAEVVKTINSKVYVKSDFTNKVVPADKKEITKAALTEIAEAFKTPGVEALFRGLQKTTKEVLIKDEWNNPATTEEYTNEINRYLVASEEMKDVTVDTNVADVIKAIDDLTVGADLDATVDAYNAAKAKYDALSEKDKMDVTNYSKLVSFANSLTKEVVKVIEKEIDKLGTVSSVKLSEGQIATVNNVKALIAKYNAVLTTSGAYKADEKLASKDIFNAPFDSTKIANYKLALETLERIDVANAITKNAKVYLQIIETAQKDYGKSGLTGFEAKAVSDAISAYNALTTFEKDVLLDATNTAPALKEELKLDKVPTYTKGQIEVLLKLENDAKALVLDYATVEKIADQEATGEAITPAVVVKDVNGKVIDNAKLNITYTNNTLVGTATIVIVPADESLAGRLEANFNIVKGEASAPVVPTAAKLATDQGIIKVTVAKVDGLTYRFMVRKANTNKWITKNSKTNSAVFTGLAKNTMYEVKVATVLGNEVSEFNNLGFVHTNKLANKPARMYKAIINKVTIKKGVAKVTTKNVAYKNEQYRVGFKKYGTKNFKWNAWGTNTVKTVKGLKKGVKYTFTIQYRYKSAVSGTFVYSNYAKYVVKTAK